MGEGEGEADGVEFKEEGNEEGEDDGENWEDEEGDKVDTGVEDDPNSPLGLVPFDVAFYFDNSNYILKLFYWN